MRSVFFFMHAPRITECLQRDVKSVSSILLIGNVLHPVCSPTILVFLNGDVSHGCGRRGSVPVLFTWRKANYVSRFDVLDGAAFALYPTSSSRHD